MPATARPRVGVQVGGGPGVAAARSRPWAAPTNQGSTQHCRVGAGHARDRQATGWRADGGWSRGCCGEVAAMGRSCQSGFGATLYPSAKYPSAKNPRINVGDLPLALDADLDDAVGQIERPQVGALPKLLRADDGAPAMVGTNR